jgi:hypothetical protein
MKPQFHQEKLNKKIYFNKIYVKRFTWMFEKYKCNHFSAGSSIFVSTNFL